MPSKQLIVDKYFLRSEKKADLLWSILAGKQLDIRDNCIKKLLFSPFKAL